MFSKKEQKGGAQTGHPISRKKKHGKKLQRELQQLKKEGVRLRMNGLPSSPQEIAKAHIVAEEGCYMRDYIADREGGIAELDFWYIKS